MKSFLWDKNFETGLDDVDEQHQYLVGIINKYAELISENGLKQEDVKTALVELSDYAEFHFEQEEALMASIGVDERHVGFHIKLHRNFMGDIRSMQGLIDFDDQNSSELLLDFLIHWLAYHILGCDQNMARQAASIESGLSASEAYENEERERDSSTEPLLMALNGLFEQVSARNKLLIALNESLEKKVALRTQELSTANQQLEELTLTDSLTKLPNRRHAIRSLRELWNSTDRLVCIMVDADHFKTVNDTHGHDAGDLVLCELARTLKGAFRTDDIVCRIGGDEFIVICPDTDLKGGLHVANTMLQQVNRLVVKNDHKLWEGSVSVGVAEKTSETLDFNELIKLADQSVYQAKSNGKNQAQHVQVILPLDNKVIDL